MAGLIRRYRCHLAGVADGVVAGVAAGMAEAVGTVAIANCKVFNVER